jgi:hypothetical protein
VNDRFQRLACKVLAPLPREHALLRWSIAGNSVITLLADADHATGPTSTFANEIVRFVTSGLGHRETAS